MVAEKSQQRASVADVWAWLGDVADPEIPVVSVVDLGIVRAVEWMAGDEGPLRVTVTPTYSGCPATEVIAQEIRASLTAHGVARSEIAVQLSPPWTTDWMTERGKQNLLEYGIAPPKKRASASGGHDASSLFVLGQQSVRVELACPRCGSKQTEMISEFGSTPCKSLHRCVACKEPFDHFKCH